MDEKTRCDWTSLSDPLYLEYHDKEWGTPEHSDPKLFELLILEGAQAGLSWRTILNKRENFRSAYANFDPVKISEFRFERIEELLQNPGIIRNRLKINAAIQNSKAVLKIQKEFGTFDEYIWQFVEHQTRQNAWNSIGQVPATSSESDAMSLELQKRGFKFVGSTICYSFMQATGMVNDHTTNCFRYGELVRS